MRHPTSAAPSTCSGRMVPAPASAPATTINGAAGSGNPPCSRSTATTTRGTPQRVTRSMRSKREPFRCPPSLCRTAAPEAIRRMIVHHAHGLHERVADRRPDEAKAPRLQVLAHELASPVPAFLGSRGERLGVHELPDVAIEAPELPLHRKKGTGVLDNRRDLEAVPDDAGVLHQGRLLSG